MKKDLLVIAGPTGVGKTNFAKWIYDNLNCTLISADSMQIYKYFSVGTAKLSAEELQHYPHELIDILEPTQEYSVAEFKKQATVLIENALAQGSLPVIVGGTGLYIEGLLFPYNFHSTHKNTELRECLSNLAREKGKDAVYALLIDKYPESAEKVHKNNLKRVIRTLEVAENEKKLVDGSDFGRNSEYDFNIIFLNLERQKLYEKINHRVDEMVGNGLVEEARLVHEKYREYQISSAIGYKEFFDYFDGKISLERAIELVKQHSRNYAKRQITWFRRYNNIIFSEPENEQMKQFVLEEYKEYKK